MENQPTSTNPSDYEILIRKRSEVDYASYCPQLNIMFKGDKHELVRQKLQDYIDRHIESLTGADDKSDTADE